MTSPQRAGLYPLRMRRHLPWALCACADATLSPPPNFLALRVRRSIPSGFPFYACGSIIPRFGLTALRLRRRFTTSPPLHPTPQPRSAFCIAQVDPAGLPRNALGMRFSPETRLLGRDSSRQTLAPFFLGQGEQDFRGPPLREPQFCRGLEMQGLMGGWVAGKSPPAGSSEGPHCEARQVIEDLQYIP